LNYFSGEIKSKAGKAGILAGNKFLKTAGRNISYLKTLPQSKQKPGVNRFNNKEIKYFSMQMMGIELS